MARSAVAQDLVLSLRRKIAGIEGVLPQQLDGGPARQLQGGGAGRQPEVTLHRRAGLPAFQLLPTGAERLDAALGGGLPQAGLTEIHAQQTRDAGASAGFALALASRLLRPGAPLLWIATTEIFREAGLPYLPGLHALFGIGPDDLLFCETAKLADALWIAEEAGRLKTLSAVLLELRGHSIRLDLTATRRLHRRAQQAGRPVFLLRQSAKPEPTAAPVRLQVAAAPAAPRSTVAGAFARSIGPPGLTVTVGKSRTARSGDFTLEWHPDERAFFERPEQQIRAGTQVGTEDSRHLAPLSSGRAHPAAAAGALVAFPPVQPRAAGDQPAREERPAHRRPGRAG